MKEGSSDYKNVKKDGSLKNLWLNFFCGTKNGSSRTFWSTFIFKSVGLDVEFHAYFFKLTSY